MPKAAPKKRGRPRKTETTVDAAETPKRRGRPSKAAGGGHVAASSTRKTATAPPKRRGRPPKTTSSPAVAGSKNRVTKKAPASKAKPQATAKKAPPTAAGGYAITCKAISEGWPDFSKDDLGLDISESSTPGVYEASFDFAVLQGVMVLSANEKLLEEHIEKLEEEEEDDDSEASMPVAKAEPTARSGLTFQLQWRGVSDDKKKYSGPYGGEVKFTSKTFKKFSGTVDLAFVGGSVEIKGERVTDESHGDASEWNDYGEYRSEPGYASYKNSNNWGYDRWGKWGYLG